MRCLGRLIGLGLVLAFVILFPCSMWTFNTQRIALAGDTYKDLFADEDFYEEILPGVLPALLEGFQEQEPPPDEVSLLQLIEHTDHRTWEPIAPTLVPLGWLKDEVEANTDSFFGWLAAEHNDLDLVFHTDTVRRRLADSPGEEAIQRMVESFPICQPDDEQQLVAFIQRVPDAEFPYCQPADQGLRTEVEKIARRARLAAVDQLPDTLDIIAEMEADSRQHIGPDEHPFTRADLDRFRAAIRLWKRLLVLVFLIPATLLSLVVIFAIRSAKTFFRWMGWALILGSLMTLVPLVFLPFVIGHTSVQADLRTGFATGGALITEIVSSRMLRLLASEFTMPILIQSAILIGMGFVFVVVSVLLNDPDAPPVTMTVVSGLPGSQGQGAPVTANPEQPTRLDDTPPPDRTPPPGIQGGTL